MHVCVCSNSGSASFHDMVVASSGVVSLPSRPHLAEVARTPWPPKVPELGAG